MFLIRSHFCVIYATHFYVVLDLFSQENAVPDLFSLTCAPTCASLYYGKFNSPCGCGKVGLWLCLEGVVCFT